MPASTFVLEYARELVGRCPRQCYRDDGMKLRQILSLQKQLSIYVLGPRRNDAAIEPYLRTARPGVELQPIRVVDLAQRRQAQPRGVDAEPLSAIEAAAREAQTTRRIIRLSDRVDVTGHIEAHTGITETESSVLDANRADMRPGAAVALVAKRPIRVPVRVAFENRRRLDKLNRGKARVSPEQRQ